MLTESAFPATLMPAVCWLQMSRQHCIQQKILGEKDTGIQKFDQLALGKLSFCWFALAGPGTLDSGIGIESGFIVL